ncbi:MULTISPECIES: PIN domain-containing protein [unclassified Lacrimispora]|uniref:PIN domain-containing protein n=1 Tax=unclassified Lacrimispora TaxID=2719232 RepID=UPI00376F6219
MKYLLMDTNIFLDMIIDRKNNVSKELVNTFIKLLDFNQVKLIIPSIVAYETSKHIEEQLFEVDKKIKNAIKAIDEIYGINGYTIEGLEVKDYKKNSRKELTILKERYKTSHAQYLEEIQSLVQKIIQHPNSIIIEDSDILNAACLQRRIYKKAPFHIEKKESFADGLIVETLLHIRDLVPLADKDKIIFVTGNTSDFSDSTAKDALHVDIQKDIVKKNLENKIKYVTQFSKLVAIDLEAEAKEANLYEEFEKEFRENEEQEQLLLDAELEDYERESVGLSSLGGFEDNFLDNFRESPFVETVVGLFERLNKCYSDAEELNYFYSEELPDFISAIEIDSINSFITKWNELFLKNEEYLTESNISGILYIFDTLQSKATGYDFSECITSLPDYLDYGDNIDFYGKSRKKYTLKMDELYLSCDNGETDQLDITLFNCRGESLGMGSINLTYGFVEFDDDGNVGDACDEDIEYCTTDIISALENIVIEFEESVESDKVILEQLQTELNI